MEPKNQSWKQKLCRTAWTGAEKLSCSPECSDHVENHWIDLAGSDNAGSHCHMSTSSLCWTKCIPDWVDKSVLEWLSNPHAHSASAKCVTVESAKLLESQIRLSFLAVYNLLPSPLWIMRLIAIMHKYIRPVLRQIMEVIDWGAGLGSLCVCLCTGCE